MKNAVAAKLAVSSLVLAGMAVGCKPMGADRPMAISGLAPARASARAAALATEAEHALAAHKPTLAVTRAEAAVALAPRDAGDRLLLGRGYLAAGRFLSAETAFQDAATLDPADPRVPLKLALAQIALGKWSEARTTLAAAKGRVPEADRGLALALAGEPEAAIAVLEPAARAAGAGVKTRQNLALAYALAGRWAESRAVAAQDLGPGYVDVRMQEWIQFAQPRGVAEQVAALLGVIPVTDPGQPTALALAPAATAIRTAALAPAEAILPEPVAAEPATRQVAGRPAADMAGAEAPAADAPVADPASAAPAAAFAAAAPMGPVFFAAPSSGRTVPLPRAGLGPMKRSLAMNAAFSGVAVARPARREGKPAGAHRAAFATARRETGNWAVQIGAYASPTLLDAAWTRTSGRMAMLAGYTPSFSTFANMHRLALSGFGSRRAATAMCVRIRAKGGACFVRAVTGDAPAQTAARRPALTPPTRLASS